MVCIMNDDSAGASAPQDENKLIAERRDKLRALRAQGIAFPNDFHPDAFAGDLQREFDGQDAATIESAARRVKVAGRMLLKRGQGKVSFVQIQDMSGRIQLFVQANAVGETYDAFKSWDVGDIVGAEGPLMRTKTGELSVKVEQLRLLTKSLRPLPDKWHGLADVEQRYRQRYVDLIVTPCPIQLTSPAMSPRTPPDATTSSVQPGKNLSITRRPRASRPCG